MPAWCRAIEEVLRRNGRHHVDQHVDRDLRLAGRQIGTVMRRTVRQIGTRNDTLTASNSALSWRIAAVAVKWQTA
jgi:hypothetical protein